jgi:hypothetical protein
MTERVKLMEISVPEPNTIMSLLMEIESTFDGEKRIISAWIDDHRVEISSNKQLVANFSDTNDIEILLIFLQNLLVRAMTGEAGIKTHAALKAAIKDKSCLNREVYETALANANYRWGSKAGGATIAKVVDYFGRRLKWNWQAYLDMAQAHKADNFQSDYLLTIKNIGYKVRDLALSSFDPAYAAFDLHVTRVATRIGLLNHGYALLGDTNIEMGSNPADEKNYLFLHKLFLKLSDQTDSEYSPADFDRAFWHLGRTFCGASPACGRCPLHDHCLTGRILKERCPTAALPGKAQTRTETQGQQGVIIPLPFGGPGTSLPVERLVRQIQDSGREYMIVGGINCVYSEHKKPHSLDYWLRTHFTKRKDVRQTTQEVIDALVATGLFTEQNELVCPDSGRRCKGIRLERETGS